ncbi:MAG: hypothetical protein QNK55_04355 [Saprospiraceae bacterium]
MKKYLVTLSIKFGIHLHFTLAVRTPFYIQIVDMKQLAVQEDIVKL